MEQYSPELLVPGGECERPDTNHPLAQLYAELLAESFAIQTAITGRLYEVSKGCCSDTVTPPAV